MAAFYPLCRIYRPGSHAVIRITELPLPLDYTPEALRQAVLKRLAIADAELLDFTLFKRSYDARKKNSGILFVCIVDVTVRDEAAVLQRFARDRQVGVAPDTGYHPVAQAPAQLQGTAAGRGLRPLRPVRRAAAGADGLQAHRAGTRPRRAPSHAATPGRCGGRTR